MSRENDEYGDRSNPLLAWVWPGGDYEPAMPAKKPDWGQATWQTWEQAHWTNTVGTTWRWRWRSTVLDLRPEFRTSDNLSSAFSAVPVNRSGVLGSGTYMRVLVYCNNIVNASELGGMSVSYYETANDQAPRQQLLPGDGPLFIVSQPTDITDYLLEGGRTTVLDGIRYLGASPFTFSPPGEGMRFWQVWMEFTFDQAGVVPDTYALHVQASVY